MSGRKAVVIGAGVAGLASAALLARDGFDVTVIDRLDQLGGRAGTLELPGPGGTRSESAASDSADPDNADPNSADPGGTFRWDTGPSWYLMPEAYDNFFAACGTSTAAELDLVPLTPAYRAFFETPPPGTDPDHGPTCADPGRPAAEAIDVNPGIAQAADLFESLEQGAGQRLNAYLETASHAYDIALERFLYTTFARPLRSIAGLRPTDTRTLWTLLTRNLAKHTAENFTDHRLRKMLSYPAVFLSTEPARAPALYSLLSHTDLVQGPLYPLGGFRAVVDAIARQARRAGVKICLNTEVIEVLTTLPGKPRRGKPQVTGVRVRRADGVEDTVPADAIIATSDLHHTETTLIPPKLQTYPQSYWDRRDPGMSAVLVMLGIRGKLPQLAHHNLLLSHDWDSDFARVFPTNKSAAGASGSVYVGMASASEKDVAPADCESLFMLVPVPADATLGHGSAYAPAGAPAVEAIADRAIAQLARWADIPDLAERTVARATIGPADFAARYHSWRAGALGPAHTLGQSAFLRGKQHSAKIAGLYYAGATTAPGVGVPMCLISAANVLKEIHRDHSVGPSGWGGGRGGLAFRARGARGR